MSWKKLQAEGKVRAHKASKKELDELRAVIARDLEDAAIQELSDDRRFATAYKAALQASKMAHTVRWLPAGEHTWSSQTYVRGGPAGAWSFCRRLP